MGKAEVKWLSKFLGISPKKLREASFFNERLRLQKAVFFLKHKGVAPFTTYGFSMYLNGPYSPSLAGEYYALGNVKPKPVHVEPEVKSLLKWFARKEVQWLEVASSILSLKERYREASSNEIYSTLTLSKPWVEKSLYDGIATELASRGL